MDVFEGREKEIRLAVMMNCVSHRKANCEFCGGEIHPETGPELFNADTLTLVCRDCGKKIAPPLVDILELWERLETEAEISHTLA